MKLFFNKKYFSEKKRLILFMSLIMTGCVSVGPDYKKPEVETPQSYDGAILWESASPSDDLPKGKWWVIFDDAELNRLEEDATAHNLEIVASLARVEQSRALARISKADFYPKLDLSAQGWTGHGSENTPYYNPLVGVNNSDARLTVDLGYEIDLWGKIRRQKEASEARLESSIANSESVKLILQTEVARDYFLIRTLDSQIGIMERTVKNYSQSIELISERRSQGLDNDFNLERARTELAESNVRKEELVRRRGEIVHAVAVLLGRMPEGFFLNANPLAGVPPAIPVGTPSKLLERRPDIAEAERLVKSANARIGVAQAAFFPSIKIMGEAGFENFDVSTLFHASNQIWSVGPSVKLPIFEGGQNEANLDRVKATYQEVVANYRNRVLQSFREVEDGLLGLHSLRLQNDQQKIAAISAERAYELARSRYRQGLSNYLDVIDAERTLLRTQQNLARIVGQRYGTTIFLIKAMGGSW